MSARWLLVGLLVGSWLIVVDGAPTAATLAAFTSEGSARGAVTAGRWTSTGPPCLDGTRAAPADERGSGGNACGPPSPLGPPWTPGEPQPPGRPPRPATSEVATAATSTPARR